MSKKITGYKGKTLKALKKVKAGIGDLIHASKDEVIYEGILIPRSELGDDKHIVIKIKSGYNLGIEVTPNTKIELLRSDTKPTFNPPLQPKQHANLPKVAIISTGGTIASRVDYRTGAVRPVISASDLYSIFPELSEIAHVDTQIIFSAFSEDLTPKHWSEIAKAVARHISNRAKGVIITHGTDTMGYTAAALSFALQKLPIPVILVGAQRSEDRPSSDAATNLIGAVITASKAPFAEVTVAMHETVSDESIVLHRGTKVRKLHTSRRDAFKTIDFKPFARVKDGKVTMLTKSFNPRSSKKDLILRPNFEEKVALIKFYPSMHPEVIDWYAEQGYRGLIFEGTGLGHIRRKCFPAVKRALDNDIIVAMTSQCIWGRVNMNVYTNGRDMLALGVIPLENMLSETALVKLMWCLGQTKKIEEGKMLLTKNLANEMSSRTIETIPIPEIKNY